MEQWTGNQVHEDEAVVKDLELASAADAAAREIGAELDAAADTVRVGETEVKAADDTVHVGETEVEVAYDTVHVSESEVKATDDTVYVSGVGAGGGAMRAASTAVDMLQRSSRLHLSGKITEIAEQSAGDQGKQENAIGPAEAAPHWRDFYGAIRASVQGMRGGE
ncbi:hypothetical protein [Paenibacillus sp. BC26]|uniref:hypothetical protein n=1 Tax=Paenibacillus sp. BC26 TaxID=1881032 RepID=UPI0008E03AFD|nr:hypothetical protein [Paenibacillus sp. BC26]SFS52541.1 hypothetical protein SAMN05428962_0592 [Paenibacillus sp. BC26]